MLEELADTMRSTSAQDRNLMKLAVEAMADVSSRVKALEVSSRTPIYGTLFADPWASGRTLADLAGADPATADPGGPLFHGVALGRAAENRAVPNRVMPNREARPSAGPRPRSPAPVDPGPEKKRGG